jgi:uncharacterized membrane protein
MKKTGIASGVLITVTAIIYFAFTETIDTTPYFRSGYFSKNGMVWSEYGGIYG